MSAEKCPLCGAPNGCRMAECGSVKGCWCLAVDIAPAALERIPPEARGVACLCAACAESKGCKSQVEGLQVDARSVASAPPATWHLPPVTSLALLLAVPFLACAATFTEDFSSPPAVRGWTVQGATNAFRWDAARGALAVTWDSSQSNSFFRRPLGTVLAKDDDFTMEFDLRLDDIAVGMTMAKPYTFQLAAGLHNSLAVTNANFRRGTGVNAPHLVEFNYFPDSGFGATVWPAFVDGAGRFNYDFANPNAAYTLLELATNVTYRVALRFTASNATLRTTMTADGAPFGPVNDTVLLTNFSDYRVDAFALPNYSDAGADGSLLAHGWVDNISVSVPDAPVAGLAGGRSNGVWRAEFLPRTNWLYTLERSGSLTNWRGISVRSPGIVGPLTLAETNAPNGPAAFYRVRAERP